MVKKYAGKPYLIKEINKNLIKQIIKEKGPISKPEIAKRAKLSLPTVNKVVDELVEENIVKLSGIGDSTVGRRPNLYEINGDAEHIIAAFFENDYIIGAESNVLGEILSEKVARLNLESKNAALESLFQLIDSFFESPTNIKAIGIGVPGVVRNDGSISQIPNITGWEGINFKDIIKNRYKVPVFVENDVNLTTIGVFNRDLKRKYNDVVFMYFGKGVGSGIIINKKLYKGISNFAGEIGYMVTQDASEELLGKYKAQGLTEQVVSEFIKQINQEDVVSTTPFTNSNSFVKCLNSLIKTIAHIIINVTCILNPEVVVLKGDFITDDFVAAVKKYINSYLDECNSPEIIILNDDKAGLIGTIHFCLSEINSQYLLVNRKGV